jgi:hypothetical protein
VAVARALGQALAPVADLCLRVGLTSPEFESVLRAVFVKRAIATLPPVSRSGKPPSDVRVGLAVGLHRNEVRRIRGVKEELAMAKRSRRRRTDRLLTGWLTDPRFCNAGGQPRDLPLVSFEGAPSFEELAAKYLPGVAPRSAIRELRRQGAILALADDVFRLRSTSSRTAGWSASDLAHAGKHLQRVISGVLGNAGDPDAMESYKEIPSVSIDPELVPLARRTLERRTQVFLDSIEKELTARASAKGSRSKQRIGLGVVTWREP